MNNLPDGFPAASAPEELLQHIVEVGRSYGFSMAAIGEVVAGKFAKVPPFFYANWPDKWLDYFTKQRLPEVDGLPEITRRYPLPFTWKELEDDPKRWAIGKDGLKGVEGVREFSRNNGFDWENGLVIPIHGPGGYNGVAFFWGNPPNLTKKHISELLAFSIQAHWRMHQLHLKKHGVLDRPAAIYKITKREIEVIKAMESGFKDSEIGKRLKISERTVLHHATSARRKLGCKSRAQTVSTAIRLGLL